MKYLTSKTAAPRAHILHLILLGSIAVACYSGLFLRFHTESLFATYKDSLWPLYKSTLEAFRALPHTRMRVVFLSVISLCANVFAQSNVVVDQYIAKEGPIAKAGVLANIGSGGSRSAGAKVGVALR